MSSSSLFSSIVGSVLPTLTLLVAIFFLPIPSYIPGLAFFLPLYNAIIIYFWAVKRPSSMPYWLIFLAGILQDIVVGAPLGLYALTNIMMVIGIRMLCSPGQNDSPELLWKNFGWIAGGSLMLQWGIVSVIEEHLFSIRYICLQWLLTMLFFPC